MARKSRVIRVDVDLENELKKLAKEKEISITQASRELARRFKFSDEKFRRKLSDISF